VSYYVPKLDAPRLDRRARSLCRQAQEAVTLALADAAPDPRLDGAWVAAVDPSPTPARLLVTVVLPPHAGDDEIEAAFFALGEMKPWLRSEVARAIHRKRAPELSFRVVRDGV
jgi:ribosome-binding factor A